MEPEEIARQLRKRIQTGDLQPGEWLREVRLSNELKTSRSAIREALRVLSDDGLVKIERFRGAYVTTPTLYELFDLFEVRAALFGLIVRYVCFRAPEKDRKHFVELISDLVRRAEGHANPEELINTGIEIGAAMMRHASADARQMMIASDRKARWHYSFLGVSSSPGAMGAVEDWRKLGVALAIRDAEAAADAARRTIYFMQQEVMKILVARGATPDGKLP